MKHSFTINAIRWIMLLCLGATTLYTALRFTEKTPVKYIFPFTVEQSDMMYPGGEVIVRVHFCLHQDEVFYQNITQTFLNLDTNEIYFTEPVVSITVTKEDWKNGDFYTDDEGYECFEGFGVPKKIPHYVEPGRYRLNFLANVEGRFNTIHTLLYHTEEFTINPRTEDL